MIAVAVTEISQVAEARREAVALAERNGFDAGSAGRVAIVVTELATNLVKHGGGGRLLVTAFDDQDDVGGIEIIAIDQGPGIANIGVSVSDGVSTAGTAGNGLGAVKRQSHAFEIFSQQGHGTVVLSRVLARPGKGSPGGLPAWAGVNVPLAGESVSGDGWAVRQDGAASTLMVVDGLGHGPEAARVSADATRIFAKHWRSGPAETLRALHDGLKATRGGAVAIARVAPVERQVSYAGVGNIAGAIIAPDGHARRMMSHNGTVGHNARQFQEIVYPLDQPGSGVVLHSDGVSSNWSIGNYPGLAAQHAAVWAAVLFRDFARGRDDATVLVTKVVA